MGDGFGRRSTDVEIADLTSALRELTEDVRELKRDWRTDGLPRLKDLEEWRVALAATELERERNRRLEESNVISKRQFWMGIAGLMLSFVVCTVGIVSVVLAHA